MGRIMSRLSKDQDTLDTEMAMVMFQVRHLFLCGGIIAHIALIQFSNTLFSVFGTVVLVFYTFPYLGIIFVPLVILYQLVSIYYRRTSVETKRWDSLLRSLLYASFSGKFYTRTGRFHHRCSQLGVYRKFDGLIDHSRVPRAVTLSQRCRTWIRHAKQGVLHDSVHSAMAVCSTRFVRKHPRLRDRSLRCRLQNVGRPIEDWCRPFIHPEQYVFSPSLGSLCKLTCSL